MSELEGNIVVNNRKYLSIVIPAYNAAERIEDLLNSTIDFLNSKKLSAEVIVVDDGSKDDTWKILRRKHSSLSVQIICLRLNRNSGQYASTVVGINQSSGEYIVTMDDDFNPAPIEISKLLEGINNVPLVYGVIINQRKNILRKGASTLLHLCFKVLTKQASLKKGSSFRLFHRSLWETTQQSLYSPEKLDIELIKNAKGNLLFKQVFSASQHSSHSSLQLIKSASKITQLFKKPGHLKENHWAQNIIIQEKLE